MNESDTAQTQAWLDQEDRHVALTIRKYGCYLQYVFGEATSPSFCYSVGLFGLGHPELIVFGLTQQSAAHTLNWFFDRIRGGEELLPGQVISPDDNAPRFLVEKFPDPAQYLFAANRHYDRPDFLTVQAYQLTWDDKGAFPGEDGYSYPAWVQPRPGAASA
ncbi:DUF4262 domain-containing protein [Paramicrobacterium chengjingii]|uniref:DUF4262 domain-containing protein n=1 Tax=Paramicrobacterium chengjingii TaxID=2769067 RepID=A0ABX6YGG0_9MICO|nr:DUF4262 domain-containing protein [Microbacterium chengjingii]QPZ37884.1 DUF4262 domain-containing protein [Microbacterium chengjingii]